MQKFIGGIGCFWDETEYQGIPGIISTECGYCGGKSPNVNWHVLFYKNPLTFLLV